MPRGATLVPNLLDTARTLCEGVSMGRTGRCPGSREGRPTSDSQPRGEGRPEPLDLARGVSNWDAQELIAPTLRKLRRILKNPLGPEWVQGEGLKAVHLRGELGRAGTRRLAGH